MNNHSFFIRIRNTFILLMILFTISLVSLQIYFYSTNQTKGIKYLKNKILNSKKELIKHEVNHVIELYTIEKKYLSNDFPKDILTFINRHRFGKNKNGYIFVLKLLNINGGKRFAIMYANPNRPDLIGKYISDEYRDAKGKQFRKEFLKGLRKHGECFVTYWYKKINTNKIAPKISFFKLTPDKKYIVAAGIYFDDIEKEILALKKKHNKRFFNLLLLILASTILLSIIFLIFLLLLFQKYNKELGKFFNLLKQSSDNNQLLDTNSLKYKEFKNFAERLNAILKDKFELLKKLKQSEEKFRTIFEKSPVAMLILDKDKFIDCNNAALKMLKYDRKDKILNRSLGGFSPEYQYDGAKSNIKAKKIIDEVYRTKKSIQFEWLHKRETGELFDSLITLDIINYEGKEVLLVIWTDISELKRLQRNLEKEREKFLVTLYSIGDGVITTDIYGKVEFINETAQRLTGFKFEEAIGKNIEEVFNIVNDMTRKKLEIPVFKVINENRIVKLSNHTLLISKDGKEYNISDSAAPIRDKDNKLIGVVLVFRDDTEKYRLMNEVIKSEKLKSVANLARGIAHDFNNILTGIYGNLELLKLKKDDKYINIMEQSLERARKLTYQLLTFAKGGSPVLKSENIIEILKDVVEFNLSGSAIKYDFDIKDKVWNVEIDKEQISEVISNLVINAKQAMKNKGELNISVENVDEESAYEILGKKNKFVRISIKDNGPGIPSEVLPYIFEPFFTTKEEGNGLGLSIVHSIIEKHNGYIQVNSEVGTGTTFFIYLPVSIDKNGSLETDKDKIDKKINLKGLNILVMDDEENIRELLNDLLKENGANVVVTSTGEEAIEEFKKKKFDLAILDLTIRGGINGLEAGKEILKFDNTAKIIVMSGYFDENLVSEYEKYGFKGFIKKPFKFEEVIGKIEKILKP